MKKTSPKTIKTKDNIEVNNLTCYRKSKDGLLMTHNEQLVAYKESIYCLKSLDASSDIWTLYDLGQDGQNLYSIFNSYGLI